MLATHGYPTNSILEHLSAESSRDDASEMPSSLTQTSLVHHFENGEPLGFNFSASGSGPESTDLAGSDSTREYEDLFVIC